MNPIEHALISYSTRHKWSDVAWGLAPDIANIPLILAKRRLPEDSFHVRVSRIAHSPITVAVILVATKGRAWPYALHCACDAATHEPHQWCWPFVRKDAQ